MFLQLPEYVEVEGSSTDLHHLALTMRNASDQATLVSVASIGRDHVDGISLRESETLVQISRLTGFLLIEGTKERLNDLAANIDYVAAAEPGSDHLHVEHYEGHPYLSAGSIPLVVSRRAEQ